jgi:hypothetical protein
MATIQFGDYISGQYMLVGYIYPVAFLQLAIAGLIGVFPLASGESPSLPWASISIAEYASGETYGGFGYYAIWI